MNADVAFPHGIHELRGEIELRREKNLRGKIGKGKTCHFLLSYRRLLCSEVR